MDTKTFQAPDMKLTVTCDDSTMEIDLARVYFGDGKWVVTIQGDDVFS